MAIEPDTKDWTWVLHRRCPECGFDAAGFDARQVGNVARSLAPRWAELLGAGESARLRPDERRWSTLEYACHVRDVFRIYAVRLSLMIERDDPSFANWDQDATAVTDDYASQQPARVAAELIEAAEVLAGRFDAVTGDQWARTGSRSDGARFTVDSFARYMIHDPIHHLFDVGGRSAVASFAG